MASTIEKQPQVRVLHKTLDILEALKQSPGAGLGSVSRHVNLPKPTVHRILNTLETRGYIDRRSDGTYRMSDKLFSLQRERSLEENLVAVAKPIMEKLSRDCRETVNLGSLDGGEVVVIATFESPQSIRMTSKVGNRRLMHTTALGKALLSGLNEKEVRRLVKLRGLPRCTPKSIVSQAVLLAELKTVRRTGYAIDNQENELDGRCIAAPIRGASGEVLAAISISCPSFRMDLQRLRSLRSSLEESCFSLIEALQDRT